MLTLPSLLQQYQEPCPDIRGLIMIDCWPSNDYNPHLDRFCRNMLPVLEKFKFDIAVSACYGSAMYDFGPLSPVLRDHLVARQCLIADVTDPVRFFEYNKVWNIQHWLVVGLSWQMCLHTRPMGLTNIVRQRTTEEFYINCDCVLKQDLTGLEPVDVKNDTLLWQTVADLGWRLIK